MLVVLESISTVFYFPMMGIIIMGTVKSWYLKTFEAFSKFLWETNVSGIVCTILAIFSVKREKEAVIMIANRSEHARSSLKALLYNVTLDFRCFCMIYYYLTSSLSIIVLFDSAIHVAAVMSNVACFFKLLFMKG